MNSSETTSLFYYHRTLAPLLWVFLVLQLIELSLVHFLLMLWNPTVAWTLFALTAGGAAWMVGLIRSFYTQPVVLDDQGVRLRCGLILDLQVAFGNIAETNKPLDKDEAIAKSTCNPPFLLMTVPNVVLRLREPTRSKGRWGREKIYEIIALKLDEPARFDSELRRRIEG